jgi:Tannase and feruloyl esterase
MAKWAALFLVAIGGLGSALAEPAVYAKQACADLKKLALDQTVIVEATPVAAGALVLPQRPANATFKKTPAMCRVVAISKPSADSNIRIEVWLPLAGWNGKFFGEGNGGFAGSIYYDNLAVAVRSGFASGATDAGHTGEATDATWALGHPEKVIDFGFRAVHAMTTVSKAVVEAFYASPPRDAYFSSCSDGGREALMEAQRFPSDYNGILAGAPAYNWTSLLSRSAQLGKVLLSSDENYLPASKVPAINKAVLAACHSDEPGAFLADPRRCHFSPDTLLCKGAESDVCLTPAQSASVQAIYSGTYFHDGTLEYPGLLPGGELGRNGWQGWITGDRPGKSEGAAYPKGYFANMVYSQADWNLKSFDLDRDLKAAEEKTGFALDAVNPDLSAFMARGGKLILYHGWNDPAISPLATIDYYNSVVERLGAAQTASFVRLFLVPGMQHCSSGPGPASFGQSGPAFDPGLDDAAHNITAALEQWVEMGTAPEQVIARGTIAGTGAEKAAAFAEPICAYPKAAHYKGAGDKTEAASYACVGQ